MQFVCSVCESSTREEIPFTQRSSTDQHFILEEAYQENKFRECVCHSWYLDIDRDSWGITCDNCKSDYYFVDQHYSEETSAYIAIAIPERITTKDRFGGIDDCWVDVHV